LKEDYAPPGLPPAAANNGDSSSVATAKVDAALRKIAQLIGRQIAREAFAARQRTSDVDPSSEKP
jgi:hypothetical protein